MRTTNDLAAIAAMATVLIHVSIGLAATWDGGGANALASTPANWVGDIAPVANDAIVLDGTSSKNMTWDLNIPLASWWQDGYSGTVTVKTVYAPAGFSVLSITGNCTLASGTWMHEANPAGNTALYRLCVAIGGDFTVGADAKVDVTGQGFMQGYGPGSGGAKKGASYGGRGAGIAPTTSAFCYGSIIAPSDLGSGGQSGSPTYGKPGGGAIWLTVGGIFTVAGEIIANAADSSYYSGSGGSVYCQAGAIQGTGAIRANGGKVVTSTPGGGGRIALVVTNAGANFVGLTGILQANGSRKAQGSTSGTIYLEHAGNPSGGGELLVRGYGTLPDYGLGAQIGGLVPATNTFSRVILEKGGTLAVHSDSLLDISNGELKSLPGAPGNGLMLSGGTLHTPPGFILSNAFFLVQTSGSSLLSQDSFTVSSNSELRVDQPFAYAGNLVVAPGGLVSHTANTTTELYGLRLSVTGDVTIMAGGAIDVTAKGYAAGATAGGKPGYGPGHGDAQIGASHGGRGACNAGIPLGLPSYGSITSPTNCGSGGGYGAPSSGGGVACLDIGGTLRNNGRVAANGEAVGYYSASGGSIWVTASALEGTGSFSARGGAVSGYTPGGGGRIALTVTNAGATVTSYAGTITAASGPKNGTPIAGAGTIYLRDAGQGVDEGTLVIDNNGLMTSARWAEISPTVEGRSFGAVILRNGGYLRLDTGETIQVSCLWSNATNLLVAEPQSTVVFTGGAQNSASVFGNTTFDGLTCTNAGTALAFAANSVTRISSNGLLRLAGNAATPVVLTSREPASAWKLNVDANAWQDIRYTAVSDSDASAGSEITAVNSQDTGGNTNWRFVSIVPGATITWTGATNTLWSDRSNWDLDRVPGPQDRIVLPAGCPQYPFLSAALVVNQLHIAAGASLGLAGFDLLATNTLSVAGILSAEATEAVTLTGDDSFGAGCYRAVSSTLRLAGAAAQSVDFGGNSFYVIEVAKDGGSLNVAGGLSASEWRMTQPPNQQVSAAFAAGTTVEVQRLILLGDPATPNIMLGSTSPGMAWKLKLTGSRDIRGVSVSDSDARAGLPILAADSTDGGNNLNWLFGVAPVQWLGGSGNSFHIPANWSSGEVPNATTRVAVCVSAPLVISQPTAVKELVVGGGGVAVTLTANATLTIGESLTILNQGTVTLNKPVIVSNALYIAAGSLLTHSANADAEVNKLDLTVLGDVELAVGGLIDVREKGYGKDKGPGRPAGARAGGSHGGRGSMFPGDTLESGPCYGSIIAPTNLGSGGLWNAGGGAVRLTLAGNMRHNGQIFANASEFVKVGAGDNHYTGAGGSVFITARTLVGTGAICANGGHLNGAHSAGGGGRIALVLTGTGADFSDFTGGVTTFAGRIELGLFTYAPIAGAGTIFRQCPSDGPGRGTVTLNNDNGYNELWLTEFPPYAGYTPGEANKLHFFVESGAALRITNDFTVGDVWLRDANTRLDLKLNTLTIQSRQHSFDPGSVRNEGTIIWLPEARGTQIILR